MFFVWCKDIRQQKALVFLSLSQIGNIFWIPNELAPFVSLDILFLIKKNEMKVLGI